MLPPQASGRRPSLAFGCRPATRANVVLSARAPFVNSKERKTLLVDAYPAEVRRAGGVISHGDGFIDFDVQDPQLKKAILWAGMESASGLSFQPLFPFFRLRTLQEFPIAAAGNARMHGRFVWQRQDMIDPLLFVPLGGNLSGRPACYRLTCRHGATFFRVSFSHNVLLAERVGVRTFRALESPFNMAVAARINVVLFPLRDQCALSALARECAIHLLVSHFSIARPIV